MGGLAPTIWRCTSRRRSACMQHVRACGSLCPRARRGRDHVCLYGVCSVKLAGTLSGRVGEMDALALAKLEHLEPSNFGVLGFSLGFGARRHDHRFLPVPRPVNPNQISLAKPVQTNPSSRYLHSSFSTIPNCQVCTVHHCSPSGCRAASLVQGQGSTHVDPTSSSCLTALTRPLSTPFPALGPGRDSFVRRVGRSGKSNYAGKARQGKARLRSDQ